jgi:hypothetical protein
LRHLRHILGDLAGVYLFILGRFRHAPYAP